jgi:hypothetical protein
MRLHLITCIFTLSLLLYPASAVSQALPAALNDENVTSNDIGPAGIIPVGRGLNASLITASQHDSSNGWSSILTPVVAYRFSPSFSINASVPIYTYINVLQNVGTKTKPVYVYKTKHGAPGDTALAAVFELHPELLDYSATFALGLPSGNTAYGLGSGHPSYNLNNHFEKSLGIFSPDIEIGIANSSSLITTRARKSYTASGTLAHFQAGTSIDLTRNVSFEVDAYEDMPISSATIYSTTGRGKKKVTTALTSSAAEDNGFNTSLDIPIHRHVTFSGFYNNSIRAHDDVVGFSLTFLLKAAPQHNSTF